MFPGNVEQLSDSEEHGRGRRGGRGGRWGEGKWAPSRLVESCQVLWKWFYSRQAHLGLKRERHVAGYTKGYYQCCENTLACLPLPHTDLMVYTSVKAEMIRLTSTQRQRRKSGVWSRLNKRLNTSFNDSDYATPRESTLTMRSTVKRSQTLEQIFIHSLRKSELMEYVKSHFCHFSFHSIWLLFAIKSRSTNALLANRKTDSWFVIISTKTADSLLVSGKIL